MGVDMPLCSRRAWTTPAELPTCPPRSLLRRVRTTTFHLHSPNVTHWAKGWPNGRGDRLPYSSWRSTHCALRGTLAPTSRRLFGAPATARRRLLPEEHMCY